MPPRFEAEPKLEVIDKPTNTCMGLTVEYIVFESERLSKQTRIGPFVFSRGVVPRNLEFHCGICKGVSTCLINQVVEAEVTDKCHHPRVRGQRYIFNPQQK